MQDAACYKKSPHNLKNGGGEGNFAKISPLLEKNGAVFEKIGGGGG